MERAVLSRGGNTNSSSKEKDDDLYQLYDHHPWPAPPRNYYACSFCKREFKSAQALGGHMNVHRRDRALLRESGSFSSYSSSSLGGALGNTPKNLIPNRNPDRPNHALLLPSSVSPSSSIYAHRYSLISLSLSSVSSSSKATSAANIGRSTTTVSSNKHSRVDDHLRREDHDLSNINNQLLDFDQHYCGVGDQLNRLPSLEDNDHDNGVKVDLSSGLDLELRLGCL